MSEPFGADSDLRVAVVGAGLGGTMMTLYLARRGYRVVLIERHPDPRLEPVALASMNLGLSRRAKDALAHVGLLESVLALTIPMLGRVVHDLDGGIRFQPYGKDDREVIHAIPRGEINLALIAAAAACPGVETWFQTRCLWLDKDGSALTVRDEASGEERTEAFDFVVGADGVNSLVRHCMQLGERADFSRSYLDWGWRELRIPAGPDSTFRLEKNAFHLWPRGGAMLFAHPNPDATFTCSLVLPFQGESSFDSLRTESAVRRFFATTFPDLPPLIPDLEAQFLTNPVVNLVEVRTSQWYHRDRVVLLGDAAHAVVPFYAQGMNAAFEDCRVLDECLGRFPADRQLAFSTYQALRQPNTDTLADLSVANFRELRDTVRSPWLRTRKLVDNVLHRLFGERWMPLHARVTHTSVPYAEALALTRRQDRILACLGAAGAAVTLVALWSFLR